jgi:pyranose oxidase
MAAERTSPTWVHWTGADTVLGPLAAPDYPSDRFRILENHLCRRLHRDLANHISYAEVEHVPTKTSMRIHADRFVVAANSFNTPQLLWESGIRPAPLGRYLTDQTTLFAHVVLNPAVVNEVAKEWNPPPADPVPIPEDDPIPQVWIPFSYPEHPFNAFFQRDAFPFPASPGLNLGNILGSIDQRLVVGLFWFAPNEQRWDNHLSFSSRYRDLFGMPQITFHYTLSESDRLFANRALEDLAFAAQQVGGCVPTQQPQVLARGSSYHYMGTFRIGESPGQSVCDPFCRVWEVDNLYQLVSLHGHLPNRRVSGPERLRSLLQSMGGRQPIPGGQRGHPDPDGV